MTDESSHPSPLSTQPLELSMEHMASATQSRDLAQAPLLTPAPSPACTHAPWTPVPPAAHLCALLSIGAAESLE